MEGFVPYDIFVLADGLVLSLLGILWVYVQKKFDKSDCFATDLTEIKTDLKWVKDKLSKL